MWQWFVFAVHGGSNLNCTCNCQMKSLMTLSAIYTNLHVHVHTCLPTFFIALCSGVIVSSSSTAYKFQTPKLECTKTKPSLWTQWCTLDNAGFKNGYSLVSSFCFFAFCCISQNILPCDNSWPVLAFPAVNEHRYDKSCSFSVIDLTWFVHTHSFYILHLFTCTF